MTALEEVQEQARQAREEYHQACKDRTVAQKAHIGAITKAKSAHDRWEELETAALTLVLQTGYQPELVVLEGGVDGS